MSMVSMQPSPTLNAAPDADRAANQSRKWHRLSRQPYFWIGSITLLGLVLFCFLGPYLFAHGVGYIDVPRQFQPPSLRFPLGTNALGQNELAQVMVGGRLPIVAGFATALIASAIGVIAGLAAGFSGASMDNALMRLTDMVFGVPQVVPVLFFEAILGASAETLVLTVALTAWPTTARLVRSRVLRERGLPYVEAARAAGASGLTVLVRHVLPNIMDTIVGSVATQFGNGVLIIAITTFVGLELPPPFDWAGQIGAYGVEFLFSGYWWLFVPAGVAFSLLLLSVYFLGEAVRTAFNPQSAGRP